MQAVYFGSVLFCFYKSWSGFMDQKERYFRGALMSTV